MGMVYGNIRLWAHKPPGKPVPGKVSHLKRHQLYTYITLLDGYSYPI